MLLTLPQSAGFLAAATVITLAPGPDNMMVLALGAARGSRSGMIFGLGCAAGCLWHSLLAAFGLGAVLLASPQAFFLLRLCGGAYLIWLGLGAWRQGEAAGPVPTLAEDSSWRMFRQGLLANAINPKVVLFFLSFLPQFVLLDQEPISRQIMGLGLLFSVQAAFWFSLLASCSGYLGQWLSKEPGRARWLGRMTALLFFLLGFRIIFWG